MATSQGEWLRYLGVPGVAALLLAALLLTDGNRAAFLLFNGLGPHAGALWANWTLLGDALVLMVLALPFVGRRAEMVWALMLTALLAGILVPLLKQVVGAPRPPAVLPPEMIHVIGHAYHSRSFPSGHTTAAFAFAGVLCLYFRHAGVTALLLVIAVGVGVSRMAVGVHWPTDVTAGAALGWLCAVAGRAGARRWRWGAGRAGQRVIALVLIGCAVALLFFFKTDSPLAAPLPKLVAVLAVAAAVPAQRRLWRGAA
jgi:membrane-associated phospholipid phosphatase